MPIGQIAGGIFQLAGGADPKLPRRNIGREAQGYINALPRWLRAQQYYSPQLQALAQQQQGQALFGTREGTSIQTTGQLKWVPPEWESFLDAAAGKRRPGYFKSVERDLPVYTPESEGLLSLVQRTQPELMAARVAGDPSGMALLEQLIGDASSLVGRGNDPLADRDMMQQIRASQSARGQGYGTGNVLAELIGLDRGRDERRIQRGQYGAGMLATRRGFLGDPTSDALRLLGSVDLTAASGFTNPFNAYTAGVGDWNANAGAYEDIAQKQNRTQGVTSVGKGVGSILSMIMGGGLGGMMGGGGAAAGGGASGPGMGAGQWGPYGN